MMCFLSGSACHESILCQGSIENTGHQLGHPIGVPIWVLQKTSLFKVVDKAYKSD